MNTKNTLEQINEVSRQLLSRMLSLHLSLLPEKNNPHLEVTEDKLSNKEINDLVDKRQTLVTGLFEHHTAEEINSHNALLQIMLAFDNELTTKALIYKRAITEQVIKIKKSKKVTKSYQKY